MLSSSLRFTRREKKTTRVLILKCWRGKLKETERREVYCIESFDKIEKYLIANSDKDSIVITMGAGDIYKLSNSLVNSKS